MHSDGLRSHVGDRRKMTDTKKPIISFQSFSHALTGSYTLCARRRKNKNRNELKERKKSEMQTEMQNELEKKKQILRDIEEERNRGTGSYLM